MQTSPSSKSHFFYFPRLAHGSVQENKKLAFLVRARLRYRCAQSPTRTRSRVQRRVKAPEACARRTTAPAKHVACVEIMLRKETCHGQRIFASLHPSLKRRSDEFEYAPKSTIDCHTQGDTHPERSWGRATLTQWMMSLAEAATPLVNEQNERT